MPTELRRRSAPNAGHARVSPINSRDVTPLGVAPLAIIAVLVWVLHLTAGAMFDRPCANPTVGVVDGAVKFEVEARPAEPSLPYD